MRLGRSRLGRWRLTKVNFCGGSPTPLSTACPARGQISLGRHRPTARIWRSQRGHQLAPLGARHYECFGCGQRWIRRTAGVVAVDFTGIGVRNGLPLAPRIEPVTERHSGWAVHAGPWKARSACPAGGSLGYQSADLQRWEEIPILEMQVVRNQ